MIVWKQMNEHEAFKLIQFAKDSGVTLKHNYNKRQFFGNGIIAYMDRVLGDHEYLEPNNCWVFRLNSIERVNNILRLFNESSN